MALSSRIKVSYSASEISGESSTWYRCWCSVSSTLSVACRCRTSVGTPPSSAAPGSSVMAAPHLPRSCGHSRGPDHPASPPSRSTLLGHLGQCPARLTAGGEQPGGPLGRHAGQPAGGRDHHLPGAPRGG